MQVLVCRIIPLCGSFPYVCIFSCTGLSPYVSISYVQDHPPMWIIPLCLYLLMHWIILLCLYFLCAESSPNVDHLPMYLFMHWIIPLCLYFLCAESSPCVDHLPILLYIYPICTLPPSFPFFLFHRASSSSPLASPSLPYPSSHFCLLIAMSSICLALLLNFFSLSLSHRAPCP